MLGLCFCKSQQYCIKPNPSSLQDPCPVPPWPKCSSPLVSVAIFPQAEHLETFLPLCLFPHPNVLQKCKLLINEVHHLQKVVTITHCPTPVTQGTDLSASRSGNPDGAVAKTGRDTEHGVWQKQRFPYSKYPLQSPNLVEWLVLLFPFVLF